MIAAVIFATAIGSAEAPAKPLRDASIACTTARVAKIAYLAMDAGSGKAIPDQGKYAVYTTSLGVEGMVGPEKAYGARVQDTERGRTFVGRENVGDAVQVCLMYKPPITGTAWPKCAPGDPRSRIYRIYDYRLHESFEAWNSSHGCGGA